MITFEAFKKNRANVSYAIHFYVIAFCGCIATNRKLC
jgi:hypothetical protein